MIGKTLHTTQRYILTTPIFHSKATHVRAFVRRTYLLYDNIAFLRYVKLLWTFSVTLVCIPLTVGRHVYTPWMYGEFLCKAMDFVQGAIFFLRFLHYLTVTVLYLSGSHNNSEVLFKSLLHVNQEGSILVIIAIYKSYTILLI